MWRDINYFGGKCLRWFKGVDHHQGYGMHIAKNPIESQRNGKMMQSSGSSYCSDNTSSADYSASSKSDFKRSLDDVLVWIQQTGKTLDSIVVSFGDPCEVNFKLTKLQVIFNDFHTYRAKLNALNVEGCRRVEKDNDNEETQMCVIDVNNQWSDLVEKTFARREELEDALRESQDLITDIHEFLRWLKNIQGVISVSQPVGGFPETANLQLKSFMEVYDDLQRARPQIEDFVQLCTGRLEDSSKDSALTFRQGLRHLKQRWEKVMTYANHKKTELELAVKNATEFHNILQAFADWLITAEKQLDLKPTSLVVSSVLDQLDEFKELQERVKAQYNTMLSLKEKAMYLRTFAKAQDAVEIKNLVYEVCRRWKLMSAKVAEVERTLDEAFKRAVEFHDSWDELYSWLIVAERSLDWTVISQTDDPNEIKRLLKRHTEFEQVLITKRPKYEAMMKLNCQKSARHADLNPDEQMIQQMMADMKEKWESLSNQSDFYRIRLQGYLHLSNLFNDTLQMLANSSCETSMVQALEDSVYGDLNTVKALHDQHVSTGKSLNQRLAESKQVRKTAIKLMNQVAQEKKDAIWKQVSELDDSWEKMTVAFNNRSAQLTVALCQAEKLQNAVDSLFQWFSEAEMRIKYDVTLPDEVPDTVQQIVNHRTFREQVIGMEVEKDDFITLAQRILRQCHPNAVRVIRGWINTIQLKWEQIMAWAREQEHRLCEHLTDLREKACSLEESLAWLTTTEKTLTSLETKPISDDLPVVEKLINEHKQLMECLARWTREVNRISKPHQEPGRALLKERQSPLGNTNPWSGRDLCHSSIHESSMDKQGAVLPARFNEESQPHNPQIRLLSDRYRNVEVVARERQRRLQDKLENLHELEKVKNFHWDEWRDRLHKFVSSRKLRLVDLERKMKRNRKGLIPREAFIDGIIKTNFPTGRMEMNAVADMFDRNGSGYIDWKEFSLAFRPYRKETPIMEADQMLDGVKREVQKCTCQKKFTVKQVGKGQFRFGDTKKLWTIRSLGATMMVRVGGGWLTLDKFVDRQDPCRIKPIKLFPLVDIN